MTSFTEVFGGTTIYPSDVSYLALSLSANTTLEWPLDAATGSTLVARIIDVTTSGSFTVTMPDATLVGTGTTVLFNNLGPDDVSIVKDGGGALLTLAAGEVWQAYLYSNATAAGSWRVFQYGASTAQAQASALAGPGIIAIGSVLAQATPTSTVSSSPYTFVTTERAQAFIWTGAIGTFNLPAAATAGNNWFVNVRNGGTGNLTIDPSGAETINDSATLTMSPGDSAVIVTDGLEWWTIGLGQQAIFAFDYTSIDVTGLGPGTYTLSGAELNRIAYQFTGALAGNLEVVVPPTIQQYWVTNDATGFTLSLNTASGTPVNIASGDKSIYYCNGTDVVLAVTTSGIATPISIADGGTGGTSAANARSNLSAAVSGANSDITSIQGLAASQVAVMFSGDGNTGYGTAGADTLSGGVGGNRAYYIDNTAAGNTAFGSLAVDSITTGSRNIGIGYQAGTAITSGTRNTIVGPEAGNAVTTGAENVLIGPECGDLITTGSRNIAMGYLAAGKVTTGTDNTCIGWGSGFEITGNQNTTLGSGVVDASAMTGSNNTLLGYNAEPSGAGVSNEYTLGNASVSNLRCNDTSISALSDVRDKQNIMPIPLGLDFICSLRPVMFDWARRDGTMPGAKDFGFIAQELDEAEQAVGYAEHLRLVHKDNPDRWEADPMKTYPVLIRAVQQLAELVDLQAAKIADLEARLA